MVSTNARVPNGLVELFKMLLKGRTDKWSSIVGQVGLCDHTMFRAVLFKGLLGCQCLMGVEARLEFNKHKTCSMINKDTTAHELLVSALLAVGMDQSTKWFAVEVIHRDFLSREEVIPLEGSLFLLDHFGHGSRSCLTTLLGVLTCSAERTMGKLCCT
jgi:hypothetical protein